MFLSGLYMNYLYPDSLLLPAIQGAVLTGSTIIFLPVAGSWIDLTRRSTTATALIVVQNLSATLSCVALYVFLTYRGDLSSGWEIFAYCLVISLSTCCSLACLSTTIMVQRDWLVVVTGSNPSSLAKVNTIIRTIELGTAFLSPIIIGQVVNLLSHQLMALAVSGAYLILGVLQQLLARLVYRDHPLLDRKTRPSSSSTSLGPLGQVRHLVSGFRQFLVHPVREAGLGLAMLYLTVLGMDSITFGYCLSMGVPESTLGIMQGLCALMGVLGSLPFPLLRSRIGLSLTGFLGITVLVLADVVALVSVWLPGSPFDPGYFSGSDNSTVANATNATSSLASHTPDSETNYTSVSVILSAIIVARAGLYLFDLTTVQIFQERVEESKRGVLNAVEMSLCNSLDLIKFTLVIFLPYIQTFGFLVMISLGSVFLGWCSFLKYLLGSRDDRESVKSTDSQARLESLSNGMCREHKTSEEMA